MAAEERSMRHSKHQQFTERLSTAASARRAMLEKFQAKRTVEDVDDPAVRERRAAQEALRAARETRRAEREAARRATQERLRGRDQGRGRQEQYYCWPSFALRLQRLNYLMLRWNADSTCCTTLILVGPRLNSRNFSGSTQTIPWVLCRRLLAYCSPN